MTTLALYLGLAHDGGRSLQLTWQGDRIVRVRASDGRVVAYRYDDDGDLAHVARRCSSEAGA